MRQSQITDQPMVPRGRHIKTYANKDTQIKSMNTIKVKTGKKVCFENAVDKLGLDGIKPVFGGLQTAQAQ